METEIEKKKPKAKKAKAKKAPKAKTKPAKAEATTPRGYHSEDSMKMRSKAINLVAARFPTMKTEEIVIYLSEVGANRYMALANYAKKQG